MAKLEQVISGDFYEVLGKIERGIVEGSMSASLEEFSDFESVVYALIGSSLLPPSSPLRVSSWWLHIPPPAVRAGYWQVAAFFSTRLR